MKYELYYWPTIQGRGEFVRLALEEAGAEYRDVGRDAGARALTRYLDDEDVQRPPFAPPFLKAGRLLIAQTANILAFLGDRHGLAPKNEEGRLWTQQLQLTLADLVVEAHDTHHPLSANLYYEDQKDEAARRSAAFLKERLPKFLDYFESVLARNPRGDRYLVGNRLTYADLSTFQVIAGLRYAFPRSLARTSRRYPRLSALYERVQKRPRIARYLASERRLPFNEQGIFRYYPELERGGRSR